jgi:hypothetical protein
VARDNHPRLRQARALARRQGTRPSYDRLLIVCEGKKTEPNYFEDIRQQNRIPSAHVRVLHSELGTEPRQVVDFAEQVFKETRSFERVFAVFDRDDHQTYHNALQRCGQLNQALRNDLKKPVPFAAVPSVPCFELWLLLHFEDVHQFRPRDEVYERLREHLPGYEKGMSGIYGQTEPSLELATKRAQWLRARFVAQTGTDPITSIDELVSLLRRLRAE